MERNPSMTDEESRWSELWDESRKLSSSDVDRLEKSLRLDDSIIDDRVKLLFYFKESEGRKLKHKDAEQKLFEHVLWFIANKPCVGGWLGQQLGNCGFCFGPKNFAALRGAWLEKVAAEPLNDLIIGSAASFIVWIDFETASALFERAHALRPEALWLARYVIHCHSELWNCPELYKSKVRERIVDVGMRSLTRENDDYPFLTCEYVCDAALGLGRLELVHRCAEYLRSEQLANAYLGLVALRENHRDLAIQLMLKMTKPHRPEEVVFRLARELFDLGERETIAQLIKSFNRKLKKSARDRWLKQIAANQPPDFEDYCC